MSASSRRVIAMPALTVAALIAVGCASEAGTVPPQGPSTQSTYPVTVDNCGTEVTFTQAPTRVLAIKSTSIELLLALGLQDAVASTAFSDGPVSAAWEDRAFDIPVISDKAPGQEATLALEPDLVYAGWESNLTADGAGDRTTLATLGVNTYVSPSACQSPDYQPSPLTFDDVFADIEEVGMIFDVSSRARQLVSEQRARLAAIAPDDRDLTALWYSSGSDTPFVGAGSGAPQMIMESVGLTNIAADIPTAWSSLSWEVVVDANPDVIVLVDSAWGSVEKKIGVLEANPATAQLPAVREGRYLVVPFPAGEAGVRNVEATESLIDQLAAIVTP